MSRIAIAVLPHRRYFFVRISPNTASPPIPDGKPSSSCRKAADTAPISCQHSNNYQAVKVLTSVCSRRKHTSRTTHTQHGQEKIHNIMIVIIIMISIRLIYIFILFVFFLFFLFLCQETLKEKKVFMLWSNSCGCW